MALLGRKLLPILRLLALLLRRGETEEGCPNVLHNSEVVSSASNVSDIMPAPRPPRSGPALADVIGIQQAKAVLHEGIVVPASMAITMRRLFWRSSERSAILLVGPLGLGKRAAAEAAASAAAALVLPILATDVARSGFCRTAAMYARTEERPVVVIVEMLEAAPSAALAIRQCLQETLGGDDAPVRVFFVATLNRELRQMNSVHLAPFGYVAELGLPQDAERKQFLLRLLKEISRVDAQWASALRESAVATLASLTANYTFAEIDLIVRRAFIRSTNDEGMRDPVALHHFEQIIADTPPQSVSSFNVTSPEVSGGDTVTGEPKKEASDASKKKGKDVKDPMDGIFGWCNFWLPEALHLPPVVWAMIIFGILAHFMARSTYQPYGHRKRRGGAGARNSLFGDIGSGSSPYPSFGDQLNEWGYPGGSPFFPPPPGMPRPADPNSATSAPHGEAPSASAPNPSMSTASAGDSQQQQQHKQSLDLPQPQSSPQPLEPSH